MPKSVTESKEQKECGGSLFRQSGLYNIKQSRQELSGARPPSQVTGYAPTKTEAYPTDFP